MGYPPFVQRDLRDARCVLDALRARYGRAVVDRAVADAAWDTIATQRVRLAGRESGHLRHRHGAENRTGPDSVNGA